MDDSTKTQDPAAPAMPAADPNAGSAPADNNPAGAMGGTTEPVATPPMNEPATPPMGDSSATPSAPSGDMSQNPAPSTDQPMEGGDNTGGGTPPTTGGM